MNLTVYANVDGTFTLPALPGLADLNAHEISKLMSGGTVRFFDPRLVPPAVDRYEWSAEQTRHMNDRDRTCRFPGCCVPAERCDADHNTPHSRGGATDITQGTNLCRRHHRMKHKGWTVELLSDGSVLWTSPNGIQLRDPPKRD